MAGIKRANLKYYLLLILSACHIKKLTQAKKICLWVLIFRSIRPEAKSVRHYLAREMRKTLQITSLKFGHFKELKTVEIPKPRNYHNWVFQNFWRDGFVFVVLQRILARENELTAKQAMEKIYQQSCPKKEDLRQTGKSHIIFADQRSVLCSFCIRKTTNLTF